ncbi:DNA-binding protein MNB1B-like [Zingiber officinale]|uniref:DNA-binding protein MNB1B-like n=1 Tax=Zingiber officinale TaxID=94328 RepID=UPI001C4DD802|nr:DNA-binding protein MNB1B-like [Zingiber officinale]
MMREKSKTDASKKIDTKLLVKKGSEQAAKKPRKSKAGKDPNTPKRPQSAFFVFMEEFRKTFKEKNPNNKSIAAVTGGDKWKSLTEKEKAPYIAKATMLKADYTKTMAAYNKDEDEEEEEEEEEEGEESDKSKSEVNDDNEDDEEEEDEEDDE